LPKLRSRPAISFVFVNDRSLLMPVISVVNSGDCTWCEYESRNAVCSVIGTTHAAAANRVMATPRVNVLAIEFAYAVSLAALS